MPGSAWFRGSADADRPCRGIFDGLDELLDTARRADATARVERFCAEYPLAPVLVTSRVVGYDQARLDDRRFTCYRLGDFVSAQVDEYAYKWFAQDTESRPGDAMAFISESASVADLRSNPLMLALLCILYRGAGSLPRNRTEVYEQCASMLYHRWDARRRIHQDLRWPLIEPTLRHLGWWLFTREHAQPAVTERELITATTGFLYGRGFESADDARAAAFEFVEFCRGRMWVFSDAGMTASGERLYAFTHRTFLEYFSAAQLAYNSDTPEQLADAVGTPVAYQLWWMVAELAIQIKDRTSNSGASRVYASLIDGRDWSYGHEVAVMRFLSVCLRSVDPSPQRVRDLTRRIVVCIIAPANRGRPSGAPPPRPELRGFRESALRELFANCGSYVDIVSDEVVVAIDDAIQSGDRVAALNSLRLTVWLGYRTEPYTGKYPWWPWMESILRAHAAKVTVAAEEDYGIRNVALRHGLISVSQALEMPGGLTALFLQSRSLFPSLGLFPTCKIHICVCCAAGPRSPALPQSLFSRTLENTCVINRNCLGLTGISTSFTAVMLASSRLPMGPASSARLPAWAVRPSWQSWSKVTSLPSWTWIHGDWAHSAACCPTFSAAIAAIAMLSFRTCRCRRSSGRYSGTGPRA